MKQANTKNTKELKLQKRLALVRTTIRELNPNQLEQVNGGSVAYPTECEIVFTA